MSLNRCTFGHLQRKNGHHKVKGMANITYLQTSGWFYSLRSNGSLKLYDAAL